jgi:glycosyltransferase involved in cell wall biosynthesis
MDRDSLLQSEPVREKSAAASRPLNFLHLTTFYPPFSFGGDAIYVHRLAHALGDAGHHVDVIHCVDSFHLLHPDPPSVPFADHPRVTTHGVRSGWGALSPLLTQQTGRPFLKRPYIQQVLDARSYDVIHFHNISLLGPDVMTLASKHGPSIKLYTAHEHWLVCPMHVLWKFQDRACDRPQCLPCTLMAGRPPQPWRYTSLLDKSAGHVDQFTCPSRFGVQMHLERGFSRPMKHLPLFTDRAGAVEPRPHPHPYFLYVGRLEQYKGVQNLLRAWERMPDAHLLIAGAGNEDRRLRAQAAHNPRINFLGAVPPNAIGRYYAHALACIAPSLTYETFGLTLIEAFTHKTPVIVHDIGALPEIVRESGGGIIYRTEDELVEALSRIASSPAFRDQLGESGYQAFLQHWSREAHLASYFALLSETARARFGRVPWDAPS